MKWRLSGDEVEMELGVESELGKILSNMFKNEAGRWSAKGQKSGSGDLSIIYEVSQNEFLLKSFTPKTL